jgi:D-lyxose ketol-isomerase
MFGPLTRSCVEANIALAKVVLAQFQIALPPFAYWGINEWNSRGPEYDEVRHCMLGWDVTDFGSNDFPRLGRTLFTLRNSRVNDSRYLKTYAEKLIIDPEGQRAPAHFHRTKREDIINRGGGNILVQLWPVGADNQPGLDKIDVRVDGELRCIHASDTIRLTPGESLCIPPRIIHQFWGEEGTGFHSNGVGYTVSSEVSSVCDDLEDNFFLGPMTRFPRIVEDVPALHYLCNEYPAAAASDARIMQTIPVGSTSPDHHRVK